MQNKNGFIGLLLAAQFFVACAKENVQVQEAHAGARNEAIQQSIATEAAKAPTTITQDKTVKATGTSIIISENSDSLIAASAPKLEQQYYIEPESGRAMGPLYRSSLIEKARQKREATTPFRTNEKIIKAVGDHSKIYSFEGKYKVMVIPVQFSDVKFEDKRFFKASPDGGTEAQSYIFGDHKNTMASYYNHASMGKLKLEGVVTPIITMDKPLAHYGEAIEGSSDKNARGLVIETLQALKKQKTDDAWWESFDNWDLSDYDKNGNYHQPDGFIDAVILIYAGKSQASCQGLFAKDRNNSRPTSADVPDGPRKKATVECYNRIWPHRWVLQLPANHPDYTTKGPTPEGRTRPAMNALKITDKLYALDYNMQSEFSDRSTFIHEFGHSLSLPDVYSGGAGNSTGSWEVMSQNANLQAQEMSSYSKISLGWLAPKIINQGETTSAYLGSYSFITENQKSLNSDQESILSHVPESAEDVYRSLMIITDPTKELNKVKFSPENAASTELTMPASTGKKSAYSGTFHNNTKTMSFKFKVPKEGNAEVSFDTIFKIETETNFTKSPGPVKVTTDFDLGKVIINGKEVDTFRLISGDTNDNTLADLNKDCKETRVLELREKILKGNGDTSDLMELRALLPICTNPIWINKKYDLSAFKGEEVKLEIAYITDPGTNEMGIVVDNIKLPSGKVIDFENGENSGDFKILKEGLETLSHNQFYLLEYRDPSEQYSVQLGVDEDKIVQSLNFDNNIEVGTQSMFVDHGKNALERFRMITFDYQPGVVAWYFNSKYERGPTGNNAVANKGKGYLLVLNSKVEELPLPGVFSHSIFFDNDGVYQDNETVTKFVAEQRGLYACFAYPKYYAYAEGKPVADCSDNDKAQMKTLTFGANEMAKELRYTFEQINELLPVDRYQSIGIRSPFVNRASMRTGLSTFTPEKDADGIATESFIPFKVYKANDKNEMVLDEQLTSESTKVAPVGSFYDKENTLHSNTKFHGDSAIVEKKGLKFEIHAPNKMVLSRYKTRESGDENDNKFRRPKVKVYIDWEK